MSDVTTHHPLYDDYADEWELMRNAVRGEKAVKEEGMAYLPMPSGFAGASDQNTLYDAYRQRAQFPEITSPAVQAMVGVIHQSELKIDIPDQMVGLWERATSDGLPLEAFHRRVTAEILTTGRYGILAGAPSTGTELPYLTGYCTEAIINWDDLRMLFVLDESGLVREGFSWTDQQRYRVLELTDGRYVVRLFGESGEGQEVVPNARGGSPLTEIPFVIAGPRDLSVDPEAPPLLAIARAAIAMYQLSADYRWQLYMTGQETLFVINADEPEAVGAGVIVSLKATASGDGTYPDVDARYVGPRGTGIEAHRKAMEDEATKAVGAGARMFNSGPRTAESGESRRIRYVAETASLLSVAQASCAALEKSLRYVGRMMGLPDATIETIVVTPPPTLIDRKLTPQEMAALMQLWEKGLLSYETVYENLQKGEIASSERTAEEELDIIDEEDSRTEPTAGLGGMLPPRQPSNSNQPPPLVLAQ